MLALRYLIHNMAKLVSNSHLALELCKNKYKKEFDIKIAACMNNQLF